MQKKLFFYASIICLLLISSDSINEAHALTATGGTITYSGGYTIHTFTTSGTFTVTSGSGSVEYLVVAGGGASGSNGGGGGAGGFRTATGYAVTVGAYTVTIGAGGTGGAAQHGGDGGNSVFDTITSVGGGGGGSNDDGQRDGRNGGSGGGSGNGGGTGTGGTGTGGQGNDGGDATSAAANFSSGGGGGASAVGADTPNSNSGGDGGAGTSSSISGASVCYAGGGGGHVQTAGTAGLGTCGGGDAVILAVGNAGTANTGGGAGGGTVGANGGSGIVIIRYIPTAQPYAVTDLTNPSETPTTESLDWTAPYAGGGGQYIIGYQINKTSPWSNPVNTILVNDTGTTDTAYVATGLTPDTMYSFRVTAWTNNTAGHPFSNSTGNILNVTTPLNSYLTVAPTNLKVYPVICDPGKLNLEWSSGAMQNINGYRIQRETPVGGGFSTIVSNTTTTTTYYNNTSGLTANNNYNYRVYSLNGTGISGVSNQYAHYTCHLPNAITDLTGTATDLSTIILTWTAPVPYGVLLGYMVNYTTPEGNPITIFDPPHTGSSATTETVYSLTIGSTYSFRASPVTIFGSNSSGNIFNATTTTAFELGNLTLSDITNTDDFKIFYERTDTNATSILLEVTYPGSYDLTCNMLFKFSGDNNTYTGLTETPITGPGGDTDNVVSSFVFNGANTEIININCYDDSVPDSAKYIITITEFELLDQIANFRNGTYGTSGQIGGLDLITLIVVIIGMIGFNRVTPIAGVVFTVITVGALAYFGIIEQYQIMFPALALVVLLAYTRTRQSD